VPLVLLDVGHDVDDICAAQAQRSAASNAPAATCAGRVSSVQAPKRPPQRVRQRTEAQPLVCADGVLCLPPRCAHTRQNGRVTARARASLQRADVRPARSLVLASGAPAARTKGREGQAATVEGQPVEWQRRAVLAASPL
jgi:hypothetical protein